MKKENSQPELELMNDDDYLRSQGHDPETYREIQNAVNRLKKAQHEHQKWKREQAKHKGVPSFKDFFKQN